jgi:hypothetical protein
MVSPLGNCVHELGGKWCLDCIEQMQDYQVHVVYYRVYIIELDTLSKANSHSDKLKYFGTPWGHLIPRIILHT